MATADPLDEERSRRRTANGENRVPPAIAVVLAATVYALLPESVLFAPRVLIPALEGALSSRAKILMGAQATAALCTTLLVIARAVGSFGGSGG